MVPHRHTQQKPHTDAVGHQQAHGAENGVEVKLA
jgi:hypothetical protein